MVCISLVVLWFTAGMMMIRSVVVVWAFFLAFQEGFVHIRFLVRTGTFVIYLRGMIYGHLLEFGVMVYILLLF